MAKWYVAAKKADFDRISAKYHISPVLARIIRNRDMISDEEIEAYLYGGPENLYSPMLLKDMGKAVTAVIGAVSQKERIRIIGDYDIDGVCATHILRRGLRFLGADVDTAIPHRIKDGYGINEHLIQEAADDGIQWIITCDNGIAAAEQIAMAKELGIRAIVTDHHEVPFETDEEGNVRYLLPEAEAVIDPKQADCTYPFEGICGAVVSYKFIQALYEAVLKGQVSEEGQRSGKERMSEKKQKSIRLEGSLQQEEDGYRSVLEELFEFAAFATVGDVMELEDENRIFVKYGLRGMQNTRNTGLRALMQVNGVEGANLSAYHIGFVLGPCLNASGRLDTAERALALLEETDEAQAVRIAGELKSLNDSRKDLTAKGVEEACRIVEASENMDDVLVIYLPDCHESIAGIVAGRVREKYGHPTFILTMGEEEVKGSGRSIESYDMYANMSACKELFTKFGGHKMAAGLSMRKEDVEELRRRLNQNSGLREEDFEERVHIDVPMPFSYVTESFVEELSLLEPFGSGNAKPLFAEKNMTFLNGRIMGKNHNAAKFTVEDGSGRRYELVHFGDIDRFYDYVEEKFGRASAEKLGREKAVSGNPSLKRDGFTAGGADRASREQVCMTVAYYPSINEFRGRTSLQFIMQNYC